jgi:hypothetical protein
MMNNKLVSLLSAGAIAELVLAAVEFSPRFLAISTEGLFGESQLALSLGKYLPYLAVSMLGLILSTVLFFVLVQSERGVTKRKSDRSRLR